MFKRITSLLLAFCIVSCFATPALAGEEVTPIPPAPPIIAPATQSLNNGTGPDLNATTLSPSGATFSYQWYMSFDENRNTATSMVLGTTNTIKAMVNYPGTFYYFCEVTNTSSTPNATVKTENYVVTVTNNPNVHVLTVSLDGSVLRYVKSTGDVVSITAPDKSGYTFTGWVSDNGGTFVDVNSPTTDFTVHNGDVTVTATYAPVTDAETPKFGLNLVEGASHVRLGQDHTFVVGPTVEVGELSYSWQSSTDGVDYSAIEGSASLPSITVTVTSNTIVYYRCIITNTDNAATGNKTASVVSKVHGLVGYVPEPTVTITYPPTTAFVGQNVHDLVATVDGPYSYTYQWERKVGAGEYTPLGTDLAQSINGLPEGQYTFRLVITINDGTYTSTKSYTRSMNVTQMSVPSAPTFTQQPESPTYVSGVAKAPIVVSATPGDNMGTVEYQWEVDGLTVVGATSPSFVINQQIPGIYQAVCTARTRNTHATTQLSNGIASNISTITILPRAPMQVEHIDAGRTTMQGTRPADITIVTATPNYGTISYQWQVRDADDNWQDYGTAGATLVQDYQTVGQRFYRCKVTNTYDGLENTVYLGTTWLTVVALSPSTTPVLGYPDQFKTYNSEVGDEDIIISAHASGSNITYQWYHCDEYGETVNGAGINEFLTLSSAHPGTRYYRAVVTNTDSGRAPTSITTPLITHIVTAPPAQAETPVIEVQPVGAAYDKGRTPVALSITVNPVTDGGALSYQWFRDTSSTMAMELPIVGATNATYIPSTANLGTTFYRCEVTNTNDAAVNKVSTASSVIVAVVVEAPAVAATPIVTEFNPTARNVMQGQASDPINAIASVTDNGTVTYQWYANTTDSFIGAQPVAGATSATFIPPSTNAGTLYYWCGIRNTNSLAINPESEILVGSVEVTVQVPMYSFTTTGTGIGGNSYLDWTDVEGGLVSINAGIKEGFVFSGWTSSAGGSFADEKSAVTVFTMPANHVVVTANWKAVRTLTVYLSEDDSDPSTLKHAEGDVVTIQAGTRPHHSFAGWQAGPGVIIADLSNPNTTVTIGSEDIEVTATWALNNSLTVNLAGGSGSTHSSVYPVGYDVSINAGSRSGYTFAGWTSSNGGTFANTANASTVFTMPDNATTITATWTAVPSGGGGGGGSSNTTPTNTAGDVKITTTSGKSTNPNDVKTTTTAGKTSVALSDNIMGTFVKDAIAEGKQEGKASVTVTVGAPAQSGTVAVGIPVPSIQALANSGEKATLTVETPVGTVTLDQKALDTTAGNATGSTVILEVAKVEKQALTSEQQRLVGDRPVIDLTITSNGKQISQLNGNATVSVPYTPAANEDTSHLVVWYLADNGDLTPMPCEYKDGKLTFTTTHFSKYVVAQFPFQDVDGSNWFYKSVAKMNSLGIMNGTSETAFTPTASTTRGMVVTMLYRMASEPTISLSDEFLDVQSGAYYEKAVGWASKNGFVNGVGEGKYAPDTYITREQLVSILYRYAGSPVITMEDVLSNYSDNDKIDDYAKLAFAWAVKTGVIKGNTATTLNPDGNATRAEIATMFSNYINNVMK